MIGCLERDTCPRNDDEIRAADVIEQLVTFDLCVVRFSDSRLYNTRPDDSTHPPWCCLGRQLSRSTPIERNDYSPRRRHLRTLPPLLRVASVYPRKRLRLKRRGPTIRCSYRRS